MGKFVVLSGPSGIGKGPLFAALRKFYPELGERLKQVTLYNDRAPRPGERDGVDYHFRPRAEIAALDGRPGYVVAEVRGDLQALEIEAIQRIMDEGYDAFFEGNPFVPDKLSKGGVLTDMLLFRCFSPPFPKRRSSISRTRSGAWIWRAS